MKKRLFKIQRPIVGNTFLVYDKYKDFCGQFAVDDETLEWFKARDPNNRYKLYVECRATTAFGGLQLVLDDTARVLDFEEWPSW